MQRVVAQAAVGSSAAQPCDRASPAPASLTGPAPPPAAAAALPPALHAANCSPQQLTSTSVPDRSSAPASASTPAAPPGRLVVGENWFFRKVASDTASAAPEGHSAGVGGDGLSSCSRGRAIPAAAPTAQPWPVTPAHGRPPCGPAPGLVHRTQAGAAERGRAAGLVACPQAEPLLAAWAGPAAAAAALTGAGHVVLDVHAAVDHRGLKVAAGVG